MNTNPVKVLQIEDQPELATLTQRMLQGSRDPAFEIEWRDRLATGLERLSQGGIDVVLLDLKLGDSEGMQTLYRVRAKAPQVPILVLSSSDDEGLAVEAVKQGAQDYLVKGEADRRLLTRAIRYAIERQRVEEALRTSEERFRAIAQSANAAIIVADREGHVLSWNQGARRIFGRDESEVLGRPASQLLPERYREAFEVGLQRFRTGEALATGRMIELAGLRQDGTEFPAEVALSSWKTSTRVFFNAIVRDVTERRRVEEALVLAERKYHSIFENTVEGIFQTTPEGRFLSANSALARIYGYESPEALIAAVADISRAVYVDPNRRAEFVRLMEEHDVVRGFESQVFRLDGEVIWVSENVRAVRDAGHKLLYYEGTVEDITQERLAEERLRDSEALYHSLVETLPQNIFRKDLAERFTFANQRFCQTLGRPLEAILGKTDFDFFPPELAEKYQKDDHAILESGRVFETVEEHQPPSGGKIFVQVVKTPLRDAKGHVIGLQGIFWDITEKKLAEERAKRANAALARSREELRTKNDQMREDLKMAREVQLAFLPQQYPTFPRGVEPKRSALRFAHRYFPSQVVSGDFFNVSALSDTLAAVFICDVMGHGVRSALITALVRGLVEELDPLATDPGQLLAQMNRDLRAILKQTGMTMYTTAFYAVADLATGQLRYANAGHPKPFLLHRGTGTVQPLESADHRARPALGLLADTQYLTTECPLAVDDVLLLFTDGLYDVEGPGADVLGPDWLLEELKKRTDLPATSLLDDLLAEIRRVVPQGQFADDICLVGMEVQTLTINLSLDLPMQDC